LAAEIFTTDSNIKFEQIIEFNDISLRLIETISGKQTEVGKEI